MTAAIDHRQTLRQINLQGDPFLVQLILGQSQGFIKRIQNSDSINLLTFRPGELQQFANNRSHPLAFTNYLV